MIEYIRAIQQMRMCIPFCFIRLCSRRRCVCVTREDRTVLSGMWCFRPGGLGGFAYWTRGASTSAALFAERDGSCGRNKMNTWYSDKTAMRRDKIATSSALEFPCSFCSINPHHYELVTAESGRVTLTATHVHHELGFNSLCNGASVAVVLRAVYRRCRHSALPTSRVCARA